MPYTKMRSSSRGYGRMRTAEGGSKRRDYYDKLNERRNNGDIDTTCGQDTQRYVVMGVLALSAVAHFVVAGILTWQYNDTSIFHEPKWASDAAQWLIAANFVFATWNVVEFITAIAWKPMQTLRAKSKEPIFTATGENTYGADPDIRGFEYGKPRTKEETFWMNGWVTFVLGHFELAVQSAAGVAVRWIVTSISLVFITQFCMGEHSIVEKTPFLVLAVLVASFNLFQWLFERVSEYHVMRKSLRSYTTKFENNHDYYMGAAFAALSILSLLAIILIITIEFASTVHEHDYLVSNGGQETTKTLTQVMFAFAWLYFLVIVASILSNAWPRTREGCYRPLFVKYFWLYYTFITFAVTIVVGGFGIALIVNLYKQQDIADEAAALP